MTSKTADPPTHQIARGSSSKKGKTYDFPSLQLWKAYLVWMALDEDMKSGPLRIVLRIVLIIVVGFLSGAGVWYGFPGPNSFVIGLIIMIATVAIADYVVLKNRRLLDL